MSTGQVIDDNANRYFEAVVQADIENGNYVTNQLQVAEENATTEKNGVTLFGSQVDPKTLGVKMGDKIKVTLLKGAAKVQNYKGMYEVTGAKDSEWCKVEKIGTANINPIEITVDKLADYQAMTVKIKNVSSNSTGTWCTTDKFGTHKFSVLGTNLTAYCQANSVFANKTFNNATGDITGVATIYNSNPQIAPRNLSDVSAFSSSTDEPQIVSVNPTFIEFTAEGGTQTITVTVENGEGKTLNCTGLSNILSATVNETSIEVTASANNTDQDIKQTLTITLDGTSSSINVPITVKGQSTGETPAEGDGSMENPYSVEEAMKQSNPGTKAYVIGYIVGTANNSMDKIQTSEFTVETNLVIADNPEADVNNKNIIMPVQLPAGDVRNNWNLKSNIGNYKKKVIIHGSLSAYFKQPGIKSVDAIEEVNE